MNTSVHPQNYFRLPWSLTDNAISWLEVTTSCNLSCAGCYRPREKHGHKTLDQIADELAVFKRCRTSDCISIAGGDPLVHPKIVDIVRMIKVKGWKPILNTNGLALTPELLHDLKLAGVYGFTFHVDTTQKRPDAKGLQTEGELNPVREKYARMLAKEGGIACSFNQTVGEKTLQQIPDVVTWAQKYPDIVHSIVFIIFRSPELSGDFDYYAGDQKINLSTTYEDNVWGGQKLIYAPDVVGKIREVDAVYEPNSYLGGTVNPNSTKWLLATRFANKRGTLGYAGARFMELVQNGCHFLRGKWLSYGSPKAVSFGRLSMFTLGLFDKGSRQALKNYLREVFQNPLRLFSRIYLQSFMVIQPVDIMEDGASNMCDGCPDITVHNGKLYWSCRLEEIKKYGCFVNVVPKKRLHVMAMFDKAANEG